MRSFHTAFSISGALATALLAGCGSIGVYPPDGGVDGSSCNDIDRDGVCDKDDNCPDQPNPGQADCDDNGVGDACEVATASCYQLIGGIVAVGERSSSDTSPFTLTGSGGGVAAGKQSNDHHKLGGGATSAGAR